MCVERNHRPCGERDGKGHDRREQENALVRGAGDDGFLQEYLQAICKTLQQAERADHIGPAPHHDCAQHLTVHIDDHRHREHHRECDQQNTADRGNEPRPFVAHAEGLEEFGHSAASFSSSP